MSIFSLGGIGPTLPDEGQYWVAPDAMLIGNIRLERDVGIWFGSVLRTEEASISIGIGTNVQDNSVIHADPKYPVTIGEYCTIGHGAIIHGCTVGDNCLVGMGATILNGARIGRNCVIAANALIVENKVVPDNSIVRGVPAAVVGQPDGPLTWHAGSGPNVHFSVASLPRRSRFDRLSGDDGSNVDRP